MNCKCKVDQRRLTPGVFNLKQFLNGSETMVWELDNCVINQGTCDLKNYDAFLMLCVGGLVDEVMLTKRQTGDTLQLLWNVGTYATGLAGYVKYQISFKSAQFDTLGVIADDPEANGVYPLVDTNTFNTARVFKKAENGYSIKWDTTNGRWALYAANGTTVVDYQTTANTEPYCGAWNNVAVGNNEAAAWVSDEAIMYISETIAADQKVTAGFPTILRQLWAHLSKFGVASVNGKSGIVELSPVDIGAADAEHGHKISEVENLQKTLNDKALQSDLSKYLPLSGGTLTGNLQTGGVISKPNLTGALRLLGGTTSSNGAYIEVSGKDHNGTDKGGNISLVAQNGSGSSTMQVTPAGALTLNDKYIASSVNGVTADASGNVTIAAENVGALPLDGGAMTVQKAMTRNVNDAFLGLHGGTGNNNDGAQLFLCGENHPSLPGVFQLHARGLSKSFTLQGDLDGKLTWGGKYVLNNSFLMDSDTGVIMLTAGTSSTGGANFRLYGKSHDSKAGQFNIAATDGTNTKALAGKPDGTLTWDGKDISLGHPNYAAGVALGTISSYTATANGWISARQVVNEGYWGLNVGGVLVFQSGGSFYDRGGCFIPVKKGDLITTTYTDNGGTTSEAFPVVMNFYPNR